LLSGAKLRLTTAETESRHNERDTGGTTELGRNVDGPVCEKQSRHYYKKNKQESTSERDEPEKFPV